MSFRGQRITVVPRTAKANVDPLSGPGPFGNLLSAPITFLSPIWLPQAVMARGFVYADVGLTNRDYGIYTLAFTRIASTGTFAGTGTGNTLTKLFTAPVLIPAGRLWKAEAFAATAGAGRSVNAWPGFSQAIGPPLPALLAPTLDDSSNFAQQANLLLP